MSRKYGTDTTTSAAQWERIYASKGLVAGSAAATFVAVVFLFIHFPGLMAVIFAVLFVLAVLAYWLTVLSRDIDFDGNLKP